MFGRRWGVFKRTRGAEVTVDYLCPSIKGRIGSGWVLSVLGTLTCQFPELRSREESRG